MAQDLVLAGLRDVVDDVLEQLNFPVYGTAQRSHEPTGAAARAGRVVQRCERIRMHLCQLVALGVDDPVPSRAATWVNGFDLNVRPLELGVDGFNASRNGAQTSHRVVLPNVFEGGVCFILRHGIIRHERLQKDLQSLSELAIVRLQWHAKQGCEDRGVRTGAVRGPAKGGSQDGPTILKQNGENRAARPTRQTRPRSILRMSKLKYRRLSSSIRPGHIRDGVYRYGGQ